VYKRERERVCVYIREREKERKSVCTREKERVCVCVSQSERERERERCRPLCSISEFSFLCLPNSTLVLSQCCAPCMIKRSRRQNPIQSNSHFNQTRQERFRPIPSIVTVLKSAASFFLHRKGLQFRAVLF